jgi:uncharacterized ion transporter superfamily protein YfcC
VLTWILPAGSFDRRDDPATGRRVVVAGTYHPVDAPGRPFRGRRVGAARVRRRAPTSSPSCCSSAAPGVVVDRLGTLPALVACSSRASAGAACGRFPVDLHVLRVMGALENMQEEIIPLVPVLLVLGAGARRRCRRRGAR